MAHLTLRPLPWSSKDRSLMLEIDARSGQGVWSCRRGCLCDSEQTWRRLIGPLELRWGHWCTGPSRWFRQGLLPRLSSATAILPDPIVRSETNPFPSRIRNSGGHGSIPYAAMSETSSKESVGPRSTASSLHPVPRWPQVNRPDPAGGRTKPRRPQRGDRRPR